MGPLEEQWEKRERRRKSRPCILSKASTREEKKRVDYLINIARYSRWWIDKGSILVNASMWCMSFLPEEFVCVRPLSLFANGNVRVKQKEIGHNLQTHYEFGNGYQDTWGNREKIIFTLVMTKVFPLFRVLLMFAFLLQSSELQQHTALSATYLSTSRRKVWSTVFILSVEPLSVVSWYVPSLPWKRQNWNLRYISVENCINSWWYQIWLDAGKHNFYSWSLEFLKDSHCCSCMVMKYVLVIGVLILQWIVERHKEKRWHEKV